MRTTSCWTISSSCPEQPTGATITFLTETDALGEIRSLIGNASKTKIAVAFWGIGAVERLGLDGDGVDAEIICNLDSGACNPAEIERLLGLPGVRLRAHASLHAKVYWTAGGAVLGSSNASTNGLALASDAAGAWSEANVRLDREDILDQIERWFDEEFENGYEIQPEDLDRAKLLWRRRAAIAPPGQRLNGSLLELFAKAPKHPSWKSVKVAYCLDPLDDDQDRRFNETIKEGILPSNLSAYGDWNDYIAPGDWVVDFDMDEQTNAKFSGIWRALPREIDHYDLRFVYKVKTISLPGFGRIRISDADRKSLRRIASSVLARYSEDEGRNAIVTLASAAALIANTPSAVRTPDLKKFDAAMEQIYTEAAGFNYYPTGFLRLLRQNQGLATARQLLRSNAMKGLTTLWEHGRLDVSVEALILKPEWHHLFTDEERAIASKRLGDFGFKLG